MVLIELPDSAYYVRSWPFEEFRRIKVFPYRGLLYHFDKEALFALHGDLAGVVPWLKVNPWNAWRQLWNWLYAWWNPAAVLEFPKPDEGHDPKIPIEPVAWPKVDQKWTPALCQAVATATLESRYRKRIHYGSFRVNWKLMLVAAIVLIFVMLYLSGRLPI